MKNLFITLVVLSILFSSAVMAMPSGLDVLKIFKDKSFRMPLVEKDPTDNWSVVEDGSWGLLQGHRGRYLSFSGYGLEPNSEYTLIYTGWTDGSHNDVWPYATCIKHMKTSSNGRTGNVVAKFPYYGWFFIDNDVGEKFWLVKRSDVTCYMGRMTDWNPSEYLFEWETI